MATFLERDKLLKDPELLTRAQFAFLQVCADVVRDSKASAAHKAFAKAKLRGSLDTAELRLVMLLVLDLGGKTIGDAELKAAAVTAFPELV